MTARGRDNKGNVLFTVRKKGLKVLLTETEDASESRLIEVAASDKVWDMNGRHVYVPEYYY